jgi:hypothetical protein
VRVRQDRAFRYRVAISAAQAECEPVAYGMCHGVTMAIGDLAIFVVPDNLSQLALCLCLGPASAALKDPLPARRIADRYRCDPALTGIVPGQPAGQARNARGEPPEARHP